MSCLIALTGEALKNEEAMESRIVEGIEEVMFLSKKKESINE